LKPRLRANLFASLYVTNLPSSKTQKADLKTALYMLFSTYGPVLDVVCLKTTKMRGQAHVVFRDIQAATQAMRSLEGFVFLGQALVCSPTPLYLMRRACSKKFPAAENPVCQVQVRYHC
jgi:RNA recognition motif-containing protein